MNYTSIEQSKKLLKLGLNRETADLCYYYNFTTETNSEIPAVVVGNLHDTSLNNIPCWSTGALLEILRYHKDCHFLNLQTNLASKWSISTSYYKHIWKECVKININLIDAVYDLIVYLLKNNYIKII